MFRNARVLTVGNIPYDADPDALRDHMAQVGQVVNFRCAQIRANRIRFPRSTVDDDRVYAVL